MEEEFSLWFSLWKYEDRNQEKEETLGRFLAVDQDILTQRFG